jgi:hypothetical protein
VPELRRADDRHDRELALGDERLRVDDEPRLALRGEDVVAVQVLVREHALALRRRKLARQAGIEPVVDPVLDLVLEGVEAVRRHAPQSRQQAGEHVERAPAVERREKRARLAALEQHRAALVVAPQEPDRAVAVPELERVRFMFALAVGEVDLQHRGLPVRGRRAHDVPAEPGHVRLAEREPPLLGDLLGERRRGLTPARERYEDVVDQASSRRLASEGSFARMFSRCTRSSSAEMTVSSSDACATTMPHGSTIDDRPYAGFPGSVSPVCAAAAT